MDQFGGYGSVTGTSISGFNVNGALNLPIIKEILAIRVAGLWDQNRDNRVRSIHNSLDPSTRTSSGRVTVRFEPTSNLSFLASYEKTIQNTRKFDQVESLNVADPTAPASLVTVLASDRLAVETFARTARREFDVFNWQGEWRFGGQKLNYVGSLSEQTLTSTDINDKGYFFGNGFPAALQAAAMAGSPKPKQQTHEVRLSSGERLFGMLDYVIGGMYVKQTGPGRPLSQTPIFLGLGQPQASFVPTPASFSSINNTQILTGPTNIEKSLFGNVTVHLGERTELSGGLRYIHATAKNFLSIGGVSVPAGNQDDKFNNLIYSASIKHNFNDNFMVYANIGSSWRPGSPTNTIIDANNAKPSAREAAFLHPGAEKSTSYEIGFKSEFFDKRLLLNVTAYHQDFKNLVYPSPGVFVAATSIGGVQSVRQLSALYVGVPAKVDGIEAEIAFAPTQRWSINGTISYSMSKVKGGIVPCNDYFLPNGTLGQDGIPDSSNQLPTFAQIVAANGGETIGQCKINSRAGTNAPFSATVVSEYNVPLSSRVDGYLRGLLSFYGKSLNDPANLIDDISAYGLLNLFTGIRDPDGAWEVSLYAKNVLNTGRILSRDAGPLTVSYQQIACTPQVPGCPATGAVTFGQTGVSTYRGVTYTAPREFGLSVRYAFGSR